MTEPLQGLDALHGFRAPPPPASLVAYGVMALAGILLAFAAAWLIRQSLGRRWTLRKTALAELAQSRSLPPPARLAAQAALLRKLALAAGAKDEGWRQGEAWLQSLDRIFATSFFTTGHGRVFGHALYQRQEVEGLDGLDRELAGFLSRLKLGRAPK